MEKTLWVDGKEVTFKSTAATPLRYKAQFGQDYFSAVLGMAALGNVKNASDVDYDALKQFDFDVFYNILWTLAKTADKSIPDPITWLDGFNEFPLFDIIPEVQDLIMTSLKSSKKK
ncbi:hypothetical protein [Sporosarcina sp. Te-1]|uniref:hypothetical protein n=1 Tax=Sporosarcina sp. Te-1 TaxID=2818390 RepID=UPI001A9E9346|nr:hypothetical protein [Sporosarcina sp. Te-1]QTD41536.1 hypothetical protein J3U78_01345 [Sporosarcina sp. Te-1]